MDLLLYRFILHYSIIIWNSSNEDEKAQRQADVYVVALLHHKDQSTLNPLVLSQWTFYVIATRRLERIRPERKSITLQKLLALQPRVCAFSELLHVIQQEGENA